MSEIRHFGILGQKWGVRRFQNPDGTLTPEGKKRYSKDAQEYAMLKSKMPEELSNEELRKLNERSRLLNDTNKLSETKSLSEKYLSKSEKVNNTLNTLVKDIVTVSTIAGAFINLFAKKKLSDA